MTDLYPYDGDVCASRGCEGFAAPGSSLCADCREALREAAGDRGYHEARDRAEEAA